MAIAACQVTELRRVVNTLAGCGVGRRVSPLTYVRRISLPVFTVHGDKDQLVPYQQAVRLKKALDVAGPSLSFVVFSTVPPVLCSGGTAGNVLSSPRSFGDHEFGYLIVVACGVTSTAIAREEQSGCFRRESPPCRRRTQSHERTSFSAHVKVRSLQ